MPIGQNTRKEITCCALLGLFLVIAYLPLSSLLFALKNDALTDNFPPKYFFSAALHAGHCPIWNPYINFGLPVYADPGFAFWNPLTWLFGLFGYTIRTLSLEILTYIWLGGIGMYLLGRFLGHSRITAFLMGAMFMCCGFFVDNLQHTNFLTCAAFLPLFIRQFLQLQKSFTFKRLFFAAGSGYLLLAGGHPAIPLGLIYFLAALAIGLILTAHKTDRRAALVKAIRTNLFLLLAILGVTAAIWLSWLDIWPLFERSTPVYQPGHEDTGFTFSSWLSFLFPFGTMAQTQLFGTDRSMRDGYISFIGLALLLIVLFGKKDRLQIVFLCSAAVILILSLGGPFKSLLYSHLPLLRYVRTNGEYRIFALFSFIVVVSWPLEDLLTGVAGTVSVRFRKILTVFALLATTAIVVSVIRIATTPLPQLSPDGTGFVARVKSLLDVLPLSETMLINATALLTFIAFWYFFRHRISPARLIPALLLADLVICSWLVLPVTGVQRRSPAVLQHLLDAAPPGIPLPALTPLARNYRPELEKFVGSWSYYSKQPGTPVVGDYPVMLRSTAAYFLSRGPDSMNRHPFLFLTQSDALPSLLTFTPTTITASATCTHTDTLVLLQNDFPGWQAWIDGHPCRPTPAYGSFLSIPLPAGATHQVLFHFSATHAIRYLSISLAAILVLLLAALFPPPGLTKIKSK